MVLEEIRKDTVDKKGKTHNKLVGVAFAKEDSIIIEIKNRDLDEAVLVDLASLIKPHVDEDTMNGMKAICKSIHEKLKQIAS